MKTAPCQKFREQRGAALLVVLVMIVIVGLVAGMTGMSWKSIVQRAREAELFWRGDQYRKAIQSYYEDGKSGGGKPAGQYPAKLEDLLKDPRSLTPKKHIRRLFVDPMTGGEWEPLKDKAGRITGVRSSSNLEPFQQDGFPEEYDSFVGATSYQSWEFIYLPSAKAIAGATKPTQEPTGSGEEK